MTIRNLAIAPALAAALLLAACSGSGDHAEAEAGAPRSSSAGRPEGNIAAGEQLANTKGAATGQSCIDCHGADGNAPIDPSYPKLGGQYADYLGHALSGYRNGTRDHALMSAQAKSLTDQQIADLSAYFASRNGDLVDLTRMND